jgi:hypothetical protein
LFRGDNPKLLPQKIIQKGLVNFSFLQTDQLNYFPELFGFLKILNGSNHVKWAPKKALEQLQFLI